MIAEQEEMEDTVVGRHSELSPPLSFLRPASPHLIPPPPCLCRNTASCVYPALLFLSLSTCKPITLLQCPTAAQSAPRSSPPRLPIRQNPPQLSDNEPSPPSQSRSPNVGVQQQSWIRGLHIDIAMTIHDAGARGGPEDGAGKG
jgi:hypothetical protein